MDLKEVAAYLRLGERTVYALVKDRKIPCSRVTGKWLFPKRLIDLWIDENTDAASVPNVQKRAQVAATVPRVVAGSHDPLLEWTVRESGASLALLTGGSRDGIARLVRGEAVVAGIHLYDRESGEFNRRAIAEMPPGEWLAITMAHRRQGLVVATGNPLGIQSVADVARLKARVVLRQPGAGSRELWDALTAEAGIPAGGMAVLDAPALTEMDLALAIKAGAADAGLAIESAATSTGLTFIPLMTERFDLVMSRREYFSADVQRLMAAMMSEAFVARSTRLHGYDVSHRGEVIFNA